MAETYGTPVTRRYMDVRPLQPSPTPARDDLSYLPLLSTLRSEDQDKITKFLRPQDKLMSLASCLLKYHFIHTTARIPWSDVRISRWPAPHRRPYWQPPENWSNDEVKGLEFNVSHQAGLVVLLGCATANRPSEADLRPDPMVMSRSFAVDAVRHQNASEIPNPRLGVDVTCTNETGRTPQDMVSDQDFNKWIDVFSEMFGQRERRNMKLRPLADGEVGSSGLTEVVAKLRRFYTYWALKEAFIKMVGEGLLAAWLRDLEFENVRVPLPVAVVTSAKARQEPSGGNDHAEQVGLGGVVDDFRVLLHGVEIPKNQVKMDIVAFEDGFLIASAMKNVEASAHPKPEWIRLDIENDVQACAEARCQCLNR